MFKVAICTSDILHIKTLPRKTNRQKEEGQWNAFGHIKTRDAMEKGRKCTLYLTHRTYFKILPHLATLLLRPYKV